MKLWAITITIKRESAISAALPTIPAAETGAAVIAVIAIAAAHIRGRVMLDLCDICGCEYQYKHGCGDTCFCEICPECEGNAKECGCNAGTLTNRREGN